LSNIERTLVFFYTVWYFNIKYISARVTKIAPDTRQHSMPRQFLAWRCRTALPL